MAEAPLADSAREHPQCCAAEHRHHDGHTPICSAAGTCCAFTALLPSASLAPSPELVRVIEPAPEPHIAPSFMTEGVERPPRPTLV